MADQNTGAPEQAPIRFDAPVPAAASGGDGTAASAAALSCAKCSSPIGAYYYEAGGAVYCARCKRAIEEATSSSGGFGRGALFGLGAAMLGAFGYWAFIKITDIDWALVSIAVAAFVATAIRKGNGGRGSRRFQILAVALTYLAIGGAYAPFVIAGLREGGEKTAATHVAGDSTGMTATTDATEADVADDGAAPAVEHDSLSAPATTHAAAGVTKTSPPAAIGLFFGAVLLVALAGPIISVIGGGFPGSLINIAIIGFALQRAWQMTGGAAAATGGHAFTGPYKVGARESAG
jgi:hypothetical protein